MAGVFLDSIASASNLDDDLDRAVDDRNERIGSSKSEVRRQLGCALETIEAASDACE